ncbi:hypothetical protein [Methylocystis sp. B8]|uniref:hypothetical protein n=1 Tax=Methylocystis sp. B8 TaxID=544938 RepID=UPI0010FE5C42|nr:hypothetical protein [Methylocystis sp. B8]TLG75154.1 hypothetical protein FEV16_11640 [Methylocystis sp. B8]
MTLTPAIANKLAAILPRLASNHDGEVVATARAIDRTLKSVGADWHDLTEAFTRGAAVIIIRDRKAAKPEPKPSSRKPPPRSAPSWDSLSLAGRIAWLTICAEKACLSPWEQSFAESILVSLRDDPYRPLSPKQKGICDRIIRSAFNFGFRP